MLLFFLEWVTADQEHTEQEDREASAAPSLCQHDVASGLPLTGFAFGATARPRSSQRIRRSPDQPERPKPRWTEPTFVFWGRDRQSSAPSCGDNDQAAEKVVRPKASREAK